MNKATAIPLLRAFTPGRRGVAGKARVPRTTRDRWQGASVQPCSGPEDAPPRGAASAGSPDCRAGGVKPLGKDIPEDYSMGEENGAPARPLGRPEPSPFCFLTGMLQETPLSRTKSALSS